jgi:Cu(I)/Ag(I) efflux system membrane fusion protein
MYASAEIEVPAASDKTRIVAVPSSAIIDSGTKQAVLIERGEGRFEPRAVQVGVEGDGYTEILEGVKDGERVVVGANFLIDSESNLRAALQGFSDASPAKGGSQ